MASMSFWEKLLSAVATAAGNALGSVIEAIRTVFEGDPETRRKVAFSVAIIALSAKMAKADGVVTENEVDAFREIFEFPPDRGARTSRVSIISRVRTSRVTRPMPSGCRRSASPASKNCPVLEDVLDGLFHIAKADGLIHEKELAFLERIAEIFQMSRRTLRADHGASRLRARARSL